MDGDRNIDQSNRWLDPTLTRSRAKPKMTSCHTSRWKLGRMSDIPIGQLKWRSDKEMLIVEREGGHEEVFLADRKGREEFLHWLTVEISEIRDNRTNYRVPITPATGLNVVIRADETVLDLVPINISSRGILVRARGLLPDQVREDAIVLVSLEYGGRSIEVDGIVKQIQKTGIGIEFETEKRRRSEVAHSALEELTMELQRLWLARRAEKDL